MRPRVSPSGRLNLVQLVALCLGILRRDRHPGPPRWYLRCCATAARHPPRSAAALHLVRGRLGRLLLPLLFRVVIAVISTAAAAAVAIVIHHVLGHSLIIQTDVVHLERENRKQIVTLRYFFWAGLASRLSGSK